MKKRKLITMVLMVLLLLNLSVVSFAAGDDGPIRPTIVVNGGAK